MPLTGADVSGGLLRDGKTTEWDFAQPYASIYKATGYKFFKQ